MRCSRRFRSVAFLLALTMVCAAGCLPVVRDLPGTAQVSGGNATLVQPLDPLARGVTLRARRAPADDFTLIALPDTQYYAESYPETFRAQTEWIVSERRARNIRAMLHLGDIVDNADQLGQWAVADDALAVLDREPNLPYGLAVGNHDQFPKADPDGTQNFNVYFPSSRYAGLPWYGGHFGDDNDNHYILFDAGDVRFIAVFLEFYREGNPEVLAWAGDLLDAHPDRRAIVVTHFAMTSDVVAGKFSLQGRAIRDALAGRPNFFMLLGGHFCGAAHRSDTLDKNSFHALLADYQCWPNGGDGWLRVLEFSPRTGTMRSRTYSPTLDDHLTGEEHDFTLPVPFLAPAPFEPLADVQVSSGEAQATWSDLPPGRYEWIARYRVGPLLVETVPQVFVVP